MSSRSAKSSYLYSDGPPSQVRWSLGTSNRSQYWTSDHVVHLNWIVGAGVFDLLYLHIGDLVIPIGVHAATNFVTNAVVQSRTVPEFLSDRAYPRIMVACWCFWPSSNCVAAV